MKEAYCEALKIAFEMEEKGKSFYEDALKKAKDKFARDALKFLIEEEKKHIEKIIRFNDFLMGKGEFDIEKECVVDVDEKLEKLISESVEKGLKNLDDAKTDVEIYEAAMNFEKEGYEAYERLAKEEKDPQISKFFGFLKAEEVRHYTLLQNTLRYLTDPSYYFEDFGGWIFG